MPVENAFVQVIEVWVPHGDELRLHSGAYGRHEEFKQLSQDIRFARGQGLPGEVWRSGSPQIWEQLGERFVRVDAARAAGLDAGVGIPVWNGDELRAVVVMLCGSRDQTGGCIEVWEADDNLRELFHAAGYYGKIRGFSDLSRLLRFQRGRGLPGITWQERIPQIITDAESSTSFLRSAAARDAGVKAGLGIPIFHGTAIKQVLLLLSAQATPLARAFEVWVRNPDDRLELVQSAYTEGLEGFAEASRSLTLARDEGLPGRAYSTALPIVFDTLFTDAFPRRDAAVQAGLEVGLAFPVHNGKRVVAVVVLLS